jgi:NAD+ synthase (glutamine-hydrolysing)
MAMISVSCCNLNQWALDFDGNLERTKESLRIAKEKGSKFHVGPELQLSGASCEDHFLELDTFLHCEQSLAAILLSDLTDNLLCEIGCPLLHNHLRYNCRIFCLNRKIVLIRPKCYLHDDSNQFYSEKRYFTSWNFENKNLSDYVLSEILRNVTGQFIVPFGIGIVSIRGNDNEEEITIASEIGDEMMLTSSPPSSSSSK